MNEVNQQFRVSLKKLTQIRASFLSEFGVRTEKNENAEKQPYELKTVSYKKQIEVSQKKLNIVS